MCKTVVRSALPFFLGGGGGGAWHTCHCNKVPDLHRLVGLVVKASASRAEDPGFESRLRPDFFRGRVIPVNSKVTLQWLPCQAPGVKGSVLGRVVPVSVYCDWVRWEVLICNFYLSVAACKLVCAGVADLTSSDQSSLSIGTQSAVICIPTH